MILSQRVTQKLHCINNGKSNGMAFFLLQQVEAMCSRRKKLAHFFDFD